MESTSKKTGRIGRPKVDDPKVSSHVPLTKSERARCNAAAALDCLPFATWARRILLKATNSATSNGQGEKST